MDNLSKQIINNAEKIAEIISKGARVEILANKDGLKLLEIDRKVVKS